MLHAAGTVVRVHRPQPQMPVGLWTATPGTLMLRSRMQQGSSGSTCACALKTSGSHEYGTQHALGVPRKQSPGPPARLGDVTELKLQSRDVSVRQDLCWPISDSLMQSPAPCRASPEPAGVSSATSTHRFTQEVIIQRIWRVFWEIRRLCFPNYGHRFLAFLGSRPCISLQDAKHIKGQRTG